MSTPANSEYKDEGFQAIIPGATEVIAFTNSASQSRAFSQRGANDAFNVDNCTLIRLFATQDCWIAFGSNPTAAVVSSGAKENMYHLPGGFLDFIGVTPGQKLSVIRDTANGTLYITEAKSVSKYP